MSSTNPCLICGRPIPNTQACLISDLGVRHMVCDDDSEVVLTADELSFEELFVLTHALSWFANTSYRLVMREGKLQDWERLHLLCKRLGLAVVLKPCWSCALEQGCEDCINGKRAGVTLARHASFYADVLAEKAGVR